MCRSRLMAICALAACLAGCVPGGMGGNKNRMDPNTIVATPVSPAQYQGMSCAQLQAEWQKTAAAIDYISGKLARGDYDQSGGTLILPGAIIHDNTMQGDRTYAKAQELSRLKGSRAALQQAAAQQHCG